MSKFTDGPSKGKHVKSKKQVAYLMSDSSPLKGKQKKRLARELRTGKVKVKG